jgi:hypothetical protein
VKTNFITREAFQDVLISCHFAVLYIMAHRDYAPNVPVNLSETGGDVVEDLWSALGSMTMNKRTYNILEALQGVRNFNALVFLTARGDVKMPKNNRRLKVADMFEDDDDMAPTADTKRWMKGGERARADLTKLGMKPNGTGRHRVLPRWWLKPQDFDGRKNHGRREAAAEGDGISSDEDNEEDEDDDDTYEEGDEGDDHNHQDGPRAEDDSDEEDGPGLGLEPTARTARALLRILEGESDDEVEEEGGTTISSMIDVPGVGRVHKRTALRYLLDPAQALSADRIVRYQTRDENTTSNVNTMNVATDDWIVGIGSNVAVRFEEGSKTIVYAGRIRRIRCKRGGKGKWVDYVKPINLTAMREGGERNSDLVQIRCCYYTHKRNTSKFKYGMVDPVSIIPDDIASPMNLSFSSSRDGYNYVADADSMRIIHMARKGYTEI